ncbi:hypothetical protein Tco_0640013, partial [Tanacetum coccineum]
IQVNNGSDPQKSLILLFYVHGNQQQKEYKEKAVIDSGCSRHMTENKCYLDEYKDYDGGFVSFGDGKGRISGKGPKDYEGDAGMKPTEVDENKALDKNEKACNINIGYCVDASSTTAILILQPTHPFPPSKMLDANVTYSVIGEGCVIKTDADRELLAAKGRVPIGNWQRAVQGAPSNSFSMYIQITIDYVHMHAYKIATQQDSHFASSALGSLSQKVVVFCNIGTLADLGTLEDLGSIRSEVIYSKKGTKRSEPEHEHPSRFIFEKSDTY